MVRIWWIFLLGLFGLNSCKNSSVADQTFTGPIFDTQRCSENKTWEYLTTEDAFQYAQGLEGFASLTKEVAGDFTLEATFLIAGDDAGLVLSGASDYYLLLDRDTIRSVWNDSLLAVTYPQIDQPIRLKMQRAQDRLQCWWAPSNDLFQLLSDVPVSEDLAVEAGLVCRGSGGFVFHQVSLHTAQNSAQTPGANVERINMVTQTREVVHHTSTPIQNVQVWKGDSLVILYKGRLFLLYDDHVDSSFITLRDSISNHNLNASTDYSVIAYPNRLQLLALENQRLRNIPRLRSFVEGTVSPGRTEALLSGSRRDEKADLYVYNLRSGRLNQFTDTRDTLEIQPRVHADSSTIFYTLSTTTTSEIWVAKGSDHQPILKGERAYFSPSLSPDGKWLAYLAAEDISSQELSLQVLDLDDHKLSAISLAHFRGNKESLASGAWSSDSQFIYFTSH